MRALHPLASLLLATVLLPLATADPGFVPGCGLEEGVTQVTWEWSGEEPGYPATIEYAVPAEGSPPDCHLASFCAILIEDGQGWHSMLFLVTPSLPPGVGFGEYHFAYVVALDAFCAKEGAYACLSGLNIYVCGGGWNG